MSYNERGSTYSDPHNPGSQGAHILDDDEQKEDTSCSDQLKYAEHQLHDSYPFDPLCCSGPERLEGWSRPTNLMCTGLKQQAFQSALRSETQFNYRIVLTRDDD